MVRVQCFFHSRYRNLTIPFAFRFTKLRRSFANECWGHQLKFKLRIRQTQAEQMRIKLIHRIFSSLWRNESIRPVIFIQFHVFSIWTIGFVPKCNQLKIYYKFYSNESHNKVENNENPLAEFNSITMTTFIFSLQTNEMVDENAEFALAHFIDLWFLLF